MELSHVTVGPEGGITVHTCLSFEQLRASQKIYVAKSGIVCDTLVQRIQLRVFRLLASVPKLGFISCPVFAL